jgi:cytochrome o ubiquinol oxidase operon protein cyoD
MEKAQTDALDHPEVQQNGFLSHILGFIISLLTMGMGLLITLNHSLPYIEFIIAIAVLAFLALLAQVIFLFRLNLSSTQKWKSLSLVLVLPLFVLSIGLTGWMFHTLYPRTMLNAVQKQTSNM